jgi:transposase
VSIPEPGKRGPRRAQTLSDEQLSELIEKARSAGTEVEQLRQRMLGEATRRQRLIGELHAAGMSVRRIATALDVASTVVSDSLRSNKQPNKSTV